MDANELQQMRERIAAYQSDPIVFIKTFWPGSILHAKLEEVAYSVRDNRFTAVPAAHGVGKSWLLARLVLWWLFSFQPSQVVTTAPSWPQVENILWGEIRAALSKSAFPLCPPKDILQTELKLGPDWHAFGIATTEKVESRQYGVARLQGIHSPHLLVVIDEAPGVDPSIHTAVDTLITGEHNHVVKIGNPMSPAGPFYENCNSSQYKTITISAFDHPNVQESRTVIPGAVTKQWIDDRRREWGETSPLWFAKVLGVFPDESEDTLFPLSWCHKAMSAEVEPVTKTVLAQDVARFGDDRSVSAEIKNNALRFVRVSQKEDTMMQSGRLYSMHEQYEAFAIDETGVGGGVVDRLRELMKDEPHPIPVHGINLGSKPHNEKKFYNLRAELYWVFRERMRPDARPEDKIKLPQDEELVAELTAIKYSYTSDGRIKIESKDDMKKRGLRSPDKADAAILAAAIAWRGAKNPIEKPKSVGTELTEYRKSQKKSVASRL